ncbi:PAS domain-containing protein [Sphingomonas mesophila]|uniref:PAS domain-containing protein n=1 Tax=Sphingomonas mesophila TaxID=2303576 RepID=UPI000E567496|nr:PAS domain-containing protein [Sphingomonas mesophila]
MSPIATVISNPRKPDNPIEVANEAFCELTGYGESEIVGRNCRFLAGPHSDPRATARIRRAISEKRPTLVEILNYRKDGTPFRNGVMITPLFGDDGEVEYYLGSQVDLGPAGEMDRRRLTAAERIADLPRRQREVLEAMARGLLNKQIAHQLGIAEKTVKMHRALMLERLGAATSADAIRVAVEAGL